MLLKTICFYLTVLSTEAARILVVCPTPSHSHQIFCRTIYEELAIRGHNVISFTTDPINNTSLKTLTEINMNHLHDINIKTKHDRLITDMYRIEIVYEIQKRLTKAVNRIFLHPTMKELLKNPKEHFDLVIIEWCVNPSLSVLAKRFKAPLVGLRSLGLRLEGHDTIANPTNPSYLPVAYMDFEKNFWGRLDNFLFSLLWRLQHHFLIFPAAKNIVKQHFPNISDSLVDIEKNVSIILTNTHPILTGSRPLVPSIVEVPGIHLRRQHRVMTQDLENYLNKSSNGVIYFNLGNHVHSSTLSKSLLDELIGVLNEVPFDVLWKWETDNLPKVGGNIKLLKWLPQQKILGHPNVKLFITHGGLLSFQEAVEYKIPLIGIPFFADQYVNVRRMVDLGIGKYLDVRTLTKDSFLASINDVIYNDTYKKNIVMVSTLIKDRNENPLEKAVWWIEYVLRNKGAPHLKTEAVNMNWMEYLLLDVIALILFCLLLFCILVYYLLFLCVVIFTKFIKSNHKKKIKTE